VNAAALKEIAPFAELSEDEREELAALLEARELSPGETLFVEGDDADALVVVREGALALSSRRARETWEAGAGSVVGALSLFAVGVRETTASGAGRADLRLLRRDAFLRLAEDNPRAACRIAMAITAELAAHARLAIAGNAAPGPLDPVDRSDPGE
jgi:CRP-like cAMP-binding protein